MNKYQLVFFISIYILFVCVACIPVLSMILNHYHASFSMLLMVVIMLTVSHKLNYFPSYTERILINEPTCHPSCCLSVLQVGHRVKEPVQ